MIRYYKYKYGLMKAEFINQEVTLYYSQTSSNVVPQYSLKTFHSMIANSNLKFKNISEEEYIVLKIINS